MKRYRLKRKYARILRSFFLIVFGCIFLYSSYNIVIWLLNSNETKKEIKNITKNTTINIVKDDDSIKFVNQDPDYYHLYKDVDLIDVDFDELIKTNNQTKGWLKVNNTNINYPFVQAADNDYYLTHTFNKRSNGGGWVFLDYRNNPDFNDTNTIIYGHGRQDKTIFGTLGYVLKDGYIDKKDNQFIYVSTPTKNLTYQIFSAYKIPNTSDYIQTDFTGEKEIQKFFDMLKERNAINIDVPISSSDKVITLSTCFNNDVKIVVHAKLVKYMER